MNLLTRLFALHFDRSFSGKGWRQLAWLFGVIVTVFLLIYLVSFAFIFPEPSLEEWTGIDKDVPMGRLLQLICLFIDPGNIVEVPPYLRWFSLLVVVLGLILFCGLLISVISNMLERRVERYREGDIFTLCKTTSSLSVLTTWSPLLSSKFAMTHIMGIAIF